MFQPVVITCLFLITASWEAEEFDPSDLAGCFATVFAKLPSEVKVYPSENYFYWRIDTPDGRITRGNLRLAANRRDRGELSFSAGSKHQVFSAEEGVLVERLHQFEYAVTYQSKRVTFLLNRLSQKPPKKFSLREGERFVQRTYDESGHQFILLYNTRFRDFLWVLNEEDGVDAPGRYVERDGILVGKESGFVFWQDRDRKVLVAVRAENVSANNEFDGPFDQLADNDADRTPLQELLIDRDPDLVGQIDQFGNFKNRQPPSRIALTNYLKYNSVDEAAGFLREAQRSADPYRHLSKVGRSE